MRLGKQFAMLTSVVMLFLAAPVSAMQFGIGAGLNGGVVQGLDEDDEVEGERRGGQIGFLLDTANRNSAFNYRLFISYGEGETGDFEIDNDPISDSYEEDYTEFMITNTLRFRLSDRNVDFWIGPSIYLGSVKHEYQDEDRGQGPFFGIGPTLGFNFAMGGYSKLCLEAAYRYGVTALDQEGFVENGDDEFAFASSDFLIRLGVLF